MKKILAAIAMLLAVVPFIGAKALNETTNYYNYKKGQAANFYRNQQAESAHLGEANEAIILDNKDTSNKFVKVWLLGYGMGGKQKPYDDLTDTAFVDMTSQTSARSLLINYMGQAGFQDGDEATNTDYIYTLTDKTKGINLISLEELDDVFGLVDISPTGNTSGTNVYRIADRSVIDRDGKELFTLYQEFEKFTKAEDYTGVQFRKNGIWTSTVAKKEGGYVWVYAIEFQFDANENITDILVKAEKVEDNPTTMFAFIPTAWVNKTADCHEEPIVEEHCYKCKKTEGGFEWVIKKSNEVDTDVCELEQDSTKCNPKTGSKSHLLEFSIVAALCAISLLVVRRKDLFRTI